MIFTAMGIVGTSALELKTLFYVITSRLDGDSALRGIITVALIAICMIVPYLLGSINPAIIFSKLFYHDDVRSHGSGNAGTTNILRTYGKKMAALTFGCDFLKAAVSVIIGSLIYGKTIGGAIAGLFVIIGHMFPIYYKFKGGKGVLATASMALILSPIPFLILFLIFVLIVGTSKYVSLGSVTVAVLYPVVLSAYFSFRFPAMEHPLPGFAALTSIALAIIIVWCHRGNLVRISNRTERKISFGKKPKEPEASNEGDDEE